MNNLTYIAGQFTTDGQVTQVEEFGNGNINDTYIVTSPNQETFVLQRINTRVFKQPHLIMRNMRAFTEHVHERVRREKRVWESPRVIPVQNGNDFFIDEEQGFWRAISYISNARSFDTIQDLEHARQVGYALGVFQNLISDLPVSSLADTLEGFHITPHYLRQYDQALPKHNRNLNAEVKFGIQFIEDRRDLANALETAGLPMRPIHGDPKVNNVMINTETGKAISIVDLDTVKPGLVHYDIGDCIRSGSNPLGEDAEDWEAVQYNPELGSALLEGYLAEAQAFLTSADYDHLYTSIRLLTFELGLRFLSDYLAGDVYFKVKHPDHNLKRALVQFQLTRSIEAYEAEIRHNIKKSVKI